MKLNQVVHNKVHTSEETVKQFFIPSLACSAQNEGLLHIHLKYFDLRRMKVRAAYVKF